MAVGDGSNTDRLRPTLGEASISDVSSVGLSTTKACVVVNGTLWCWGSRASVDGLSPSPFPVRQSEFAEPVIQVATNVQDCVTDIQGGVFCRGNNANGMLGNGSRVDSIATPVPVASLSRGVIQMKVFDSSAYALTEDGRVWGWGAAAGVGLGFLERALVPAPVVGLEGRFMTQIDGEHWFYCALDRSGSILCWGTFPAEGAEFPYMDTPVPIDAFGEGNVQIAVGREMLCALKPTGVVVCAGLNESGQLGDGTRTNHFSAEAVRGLPVAAAEIDAGVSFVCARLVDGTLWCWGNNFSGQLGVGDTRDRTLPAQVKFPACCGT